MLPKMSIAKGTAVSNVWLTAALKNCVHPARPRREVQYVISELVHRLHHSNDWLVSLCGFLPHAPYVISCQSR